MQKLITFLDENKILNVTHGNKHCREGWVQVACPFCPGGDHNFHLGINVAGQYTYCYRCGWHSIDSLFNVLLGIKRSECKAIKRNVFGVVVKSATQEKFTSCSNFVLPGEASANDIEPAFEYLASRFQDRDVKSLIEYYGLRASGFYYEYPCEHNPYKYTNMVVIPNYLNGTPVSFQCRSYIPGMSGYRSAAPEEELVHHKSFLWGIDRVKYDSVILVESAFNAMSIGDGAVHTHGVGYTANQLAELGTFSKVYLALDNDKAGEQAAKRLVKLLSHKTKVILITYGYAGCDINDLCKTKDGQKELMEMRELVN